MAAIVGGIVKDGLVVPNAPLPEGARVEIVVPGPVPALPPELRDEINAWDGASARALDLVERLAREKGADLDHLTQ